MRTRRTPPVADTRRPPRRHSFVPGARVSSSPVERASRRALTPTTPEPPPRARRSVAWHRWISPLARPRDLAARLEHRPARRGRARPRPGGWSSPPSTSPPAASCPRASLVSLVRVVIGLALGVSVGAALGLVVRAVALGRNLLSTRPCRCCARCRTSRSCRCSSSGSASTRHPKILLVALGVAVPDLPQRPRRRPRRRPRARSRPRPRLRVHALASGCATSCCPARCRSALTGLRLALGIAWLSIVVAETVSTPTPASAT